MSLKDKFTSFLEGMGIAIWIEIVTELPNCTYYFGPFFNFPEAELAKSGYIEDLEAEGASIITVEIKRCKPDNYTVFDESMDSRPTQVPTLSGQPG